MLSQLQIDNMKIAAHHAAACWKITGISVELMVAQWALESGWGKSQPGNNCFGIKEYHGCHGIQLLKTGEHMTLAESVKWLAEREGRTAIYNPNLSPDYNGRFTWSCQDYFATFASLTDCFKKRAQLFLVPPYYAISRQYQVSGDLLELIRDTSKIYAPTTHNYPDVIISILAYSEVKEAIEQAKSSL